MNLKKGQGWCRPANTDLLLDAIYMRFGQMAWQCAPNCSICLIICFFVLSYIQTFVIYRLQTPVHFQQTFARQRAWDGSTSKNARKNLACDIY